MSDSKKPREFWIVNEARVYTCLGFVIDAHGLRPRPDETSRIHVIEKSASDKLADAFERVLDASAYADRYDDDIVLGKIALKEYRGEQCAT